MTKPSFARKNNKSTETQKNETPPFRVMLVDDEREYIDAFNNGVMQFNIFTLSQKVDGRTCLTKNSDALLKQLLEWKTNGQWVPDLILIDKSIAASKGPSQTYVEKLQGRYGEIMDFVSIPVVIHTKAAPNPEDAKSFLDGRADGYQWNRTSDSAYIQQCLDTFPMWQAQAHRRVWQTLLDLSSEKLASTESLEEAIAVLSVFSLPFMHNHLGCENIFIRRQSVGDHYPLIACFPQKSWATDKETERLADIPLIKEILEKKYAKRDQIQKEDAGIYEELRNKAMIGAVIQDFVETPVGATTLVRSKPFIDDDLFYLRRFAHQFSGIYSRQRYLENRKNEMKVCQDFAHNAALKNDEKEICDELCEHIQRQVNQNNQERSKVTVRLVPLGKAVLERISCAGQCALPADPISLVEKGRPSIYRNVVRDVKTIDHDTKQKLENAGYLCVNNFEASSELCVPLKAIGPEDKPIALGAINVEHLDEYVYGGSNKLFVEVLAQIVASALLRIRQGKALKSLADLIGHSVAEHSSTDKQWNALNSAVSAYLGHGALVYLKPSQETNDPWKVSHIWKPESENNQNTPSTSVAEIHNWQQHFDKEWGVTFTNRAIKGFYDGINDIQYTGDFTKTEGLMGKNSEDSAVWANAVVPLWDDGQLAGVWLFIWYSPPSVDKEGLKILEKFAEYGQVLIKLQDEWQNLADRLSTAEKKAKQAMIAQMYEHVVQNQLGLLSGKIESIQRAKSLVEIHELAKNLQNSLEQASNRAQITIKLMQPIVLQPINLAECWQDAAEMLKERAQRLNIQIKTLPDDCEWWIIGDHDVLQLTLFLMIQNALDAIESARSGCFVWIDTNPLDDETSAFKIQDDGPGVRKDVLNKLGTEANITTKPRGQGIAFFTCAQKIKHELYGELTPTNPQPAQGASFDLVLKRA